MAKTRKKTKEESSSFLYSLIKRFTIFLFLFLSVMLLLYFSGNFQSFLDSSLRIILFSSSLISLMLVSFSAIGFLASIMMILGKRRAGYAIDLLVFLLMAASSAAIFIALRGLTVLTAGIR